MSCAQVSQFPLPMGDSLVAKSPVLVSENLSSNPVLPLTFYGFIFIIYHIGANKGIYFVGMMIELNEMTYANCF